MPHLPADPTLGVVQDYVRKLEEERGFAGNTLQQEALLLGEEVGELFKALRKQQNMAIDAKSVVGGVDEELADVLIYICAIANRLGVDLETAFRDKERINSERVWATGG
jgi:NTP pyrophosphatase (non-canonical NTP hydrolase)